MDHAIVGRRGQRAACRTVDQGPASGGLRNRCAVLARGGKYGSSNDFLRGPHPRSRPARWRWPGIVARSATSKQSNSRPGSDRARRPSGTRPGPAQRGRRLPGEAVRAGGTDRATGSPVAAAGNLLGSSLRIANLEFDTRNRQASIDDQPQVLSARETAVLELLMRSKGRVVSKKQVEDHIFGHSGEVASNAIEVYVHRLRKQLSERGAKVQVHTIRGVGYLIAEEK